MLLKIGPDVTPGSAPDGDEEAESTVDADPLSSQTFVAGFQAKLNVQVQLIE